MDRQIDMYTHQTIVKEPELIWVQDIIRTQLCTARDQALGPRTQPKVASRVQTPNRTTQITKRGAPEASLKTHTHTPHQVMHETVTPFPTYRSQGSAPSCSGALAPVVPGLV